MKELMPIPAGSIFYFSEGCYSDYQIEGVFRALKDLEPETLWRAYDVFRPKRGSDSGYDNGNFMAYLIRARLIEPLDSFEWHVGGYGADAEEWTVDRHEGRK